MSGYVLNPDAIGDPDQTPRVQLIGGTGVRHVSLRALLDKLSDQAEDTTEPEPDWPPVAEPGSGVPTDFEDEK